MSEAKKKNLKELHEANVERVLDPVAREYSGHVDTSDGEVLHVDAGHGVCQVGEAVFDLDGVIRLRQVLDHAYLALT